MILIAESKTMATAQTKFSAEEYNRHRPLYGSIADGIMHTIAGKSADEIAAGACISLSLARGLNRMAYDFPDKSTGLRAIESFTGVVFRQLHLDEYSDAERRCLDSRVRIISSLYGWLRPDDIIKPYRLEFKSKEAPAAGETMMRFWRKDITMALVKELKAEADTEIIDLLPSDAAKCIDWKLTKRFAKVYHIDFKTPVGPDTYKTPNSGRLKELRGKLLDAVIRRGLTTAAEISALAADDFLPQGELIYPGTFTFLTD